MSLGLALRVAVKEGVGVMVLEIVGERDTAGELEAVAEGESVVLAPPTPNGGGLGEGLPVPPPTANKKGLLMEGVGESGEGEGVKDGESVAESESRGEGEEREVKVEVEDGLRVAPPPPPPPPPAVTEEDTLGEGMPLGVAPPGGEGDTEREGKEVRDWEGEGEMEGVEEALRLWVAAWGGGDGVASWLNVSSGEAVGGWGEADPVGVTSVDKDRVVEGDGE